MQDPSQQLGPTESTGEPVEDRWVPSALEQERAAYRSARTRRSAVVATASTLAMLGAIVALVVSSPGWPRVKETFFSWDKAVDSLPAVLDGLWLNIRVMLVCAVLIAILGLTLAVMRTVRGPVAFPLRLFATAYVDLFRGLPLLLVLSVARPMIAGQAAIPLRGVRVAAREWRSKHPDSPCPTFGDLVEAGLFDRRTTGVDLWNHPIIIECHGPEVIVTSAGPDGVMGTGDDVRVPRR